MKAIEHWLAAAQISGLGYQKVSRCLELYGDIAVLFSGDTNVWRALQFNNKLIQQIKTVDWTQVTHSIDWLMKNSMRRIVTLVDENYPPLLKQMSSPPLLLYCEGDVALLSQPQIAMVGSRNPSFPGKQIANRFAQALAQAGLVITSGLALGIDVASHQGTLAVKGKTIAVMGTGLECVYPKSHQAIAEQIKQSGLIISEFSPKSPPLPRNFPKRNRIISGLSMGVLVVEAALRSGSLITAQYALDAGREVFAVPGSIHNPLSRGCHYLLRQGAKLVEATADILEEFQGFGAWYAEEKQRSKVLKVDDKQQAMILSLMGFDIISMERLLRLTNLKAEQLSAKLLQMELLGLIQSVSGGYIRVNP